MVLKVDLDQFVEEVQSRFGTKDCYVSPLGRGSVATAADPSNALIVACASRSEPEALCKELEAKSLAPKLGNWSLAVEVTVEDMDRPAYIAAVSYHSKEDKPGLWVDAYPNEPSAADVLMSLYNEFRETGELVDITFEEFMRLAHPNVVILNPDQVARFAQQKEQNC